MSGIMVIDRARDLVSYSQEAEALKAAALEQSALLAKVGTSAENEAAVKAQTELHRILKAIEDARVAAKEPFLRMGKTIDDQAKAFRAELVEEQTRVAELVGSYQALQQAKQNAEAQARNEALTALERERATARAAANSHEALDTIDEQFAVKAQAIAPAPMPIRAEGQHVSNDWEITVSDIHKLYRFHPNCVDLKPRLSEVKELLKAGVKVQGVEAKAIVKASVRLKPETKAFEV